MSNGITATVQRYVDILTEAGFKAVFGVEKNKDILIDLLNVLSDDNVTRRIAENDMREIMRLAGGRMKDLTKIYGLTVNRIAKEITKANRIMELLVRNYLDIIPVVFLLTAVFSAGETGFTSL